VPRRWRGGGSCRGRGSGCSGWGLACGVFGEGGREEWIHDRRQGDRGQQGLGRLRYRGSYGEEIFLGGECGRAVGDGDFLGAPNWWGPQAALLETA
jgi:hypothetical protein